MGSHNSVVMAMDIGSVTTLSESINCGSKTRSSETARFPVCLSPSYFAISGNTRSQNF